MFSVQICKAGDDGRGMRIKEERIVKKQEFKNGGYIEFDEEHGVACAVACKNGSDVYLHGNLNDVAKGVEELTVSFLKNLKPDHRLAFLTVIREKMYEEGLMPENTEWTLTYQGIEIPVTLGQSLSLLKRMFDEIKKDS